MSSRQLEIRRCFCVPVWNQGPVVKELGVSTESKKNKCTPHRLNLGKSYFCGFSNRAQQETKLRRIWISSLHRSSETMDYRIRTDIEYAGDIFDDPSLSQRICPLTADNSSTETMSSVLRGDNHCHFINNSTMT